MSYPILEESTFEKDEWVHTCGTVLLGARVHHSIHDGPFPLSGSGQVEVEIVPYCPTCGPKALGVRSTDHAGVGFVSTHEAERLAEIRARVDAATPGPWQLCTTRGWNEQGCIESTTEQDTYTDDEEDVSGPRTVVEHPNWTGIRDADYDFIAAARSDVPWLLDELERREAQHAQNDRNLREILWLLIRQAGGRVFIPDADRVAYDPDRWEMERVDQLAPPGLFLRAFLASPSTQETPT